MTTSLTILSLGWTRSAESIKLVVRRGHGISSSSVHLSRSETITLCWAIGLTFIFHLGPVANSSFGLIVSAVLAAICWLTPITGFYYIACAQFLPDPSSGAMVPAVIGFYAWLIVTPLRYHRFSLRGIHMLLLILPYLLWGAVLTGSLNAFSPTGNWVKAITYSVIACQLANESGGRYQRCLWGLCIGALMIGAAYWMAKIGLPVELSGFGGERAGFIRTGSVRADSVMIWPPALIAVGGFTGFAFLSFFQAISVKQKQRSIAALGVVILFLLPVILSTMTMAAYVGLALMIAVIPVAAIYLAGKRLLPAASLNTFFSWLLLVAMCVIAVFSLDLFNSRTRTVDFWNYYRDAKNVLGTRTDVWGASWETICRYPWLGVLFSNGVESIPEEYADFYSENGYYLSHNVFLDAWRGTGLVGLCLFSLFFFYPLFAHWVRPNRLSRVPFLLIFVTVLLFYMMLSFPFYKTVWAFWMLMAMSCMGDDAAAIALRPASAAETNFSLRI